ncbi:MAG: HAD-IA family hydrolase, partial [Candidatus Nanopelagicales bacterium]
QANEITERDYWLAYAQAAVDNGVDISGFDGFMQAIFRDPGVESIRPEALALMAECKLAGRTLGILSNELMSFQGRDWVEAQDWYADFAVIIDASELGVRKPDPRPYAAALESLGMTADEVVFIDDNPTYVEAGQRAGMRSIWLDVLNPAAAFEVAAVELGLR